MSSSKSEISKLQILNAVPEGDGVLGKFLSATKCSESAFLQRSAVSSARQGIANVRPSSSFARTNLFILVMLSYMSSLETPLDSK